MPRFISCLVVVIVLSAGPPEAVAQDTLFRRPTEVTAVISNTSNRFDGAYTYSAPSRLCGETDPTQFFSGERVFLVEFPADLAPGARITDVRFTSKTLVGAVRETDRFFVSVTVISAQGGRYPALVIDTERPAPGHAGKATRTVTKGVDTLRVQASGDLGQTLDLTLTCEPSRP
jgi:hypothetical protein